MATIASYTTTSAFSQSVSGEYTWNEVNYGDTKISQTFQVTEGTWDVVRIYFRMAGYFVDGEEAGNLTVEVKETDEDGGLLGSFTKDRLTVTDMGWYYFEATDLELSSGNTYCLVLSCPNGFYDSDEHEYDHIVVTYNSAAGYGDGIARRYDEVRGWQEYDGGGADFCFIVTGDEAVEAPGKATDPTPTDDQEGLFIAGTERIVKLQWVAPVDETPDYLIYFRTSGGAWVLYDTITDDNTEYTLSSTILDAFEYYSIYEWRVDTYDPDTELTTTGDTWTFITDIGEWWTSFTRRSDYDADVADKVWQPGTGWIDIANWTDAAGYDFEYTGGGRFKNRVLVIGHKVLYFGSI